MAVLDDEFSLGATLAEDGAGIWSSPKSTATASPQDFQALYEQQRARAEAAEARCEELRWTEVAARSDAGSWKSRFKSCRRRLSEAEEEAKELRLGRVNRLQEGPDPGVGKTGSTEKPVRHWESSQLNSPSPRQAPWSASCKFSGGTHHRTSDNSSGIRRIPISYFSHTHTDCAGAASSPTPRRAETSSRARPPFGLLGRTCPAS